METLGDYAYGSAHNHGDFAEASRALTAKPVPAKAGTTALHNGGRYTK